MKPSGGRREGWRQRVPFRREHRCCRKAQVEPGHASRNANTHRGRTRPTPATVLPLLGTLPSLKNFSPPFGTLDDHFQRGRSRAVSHSRKGGHPSPAYAPPRRPTPTLPLESMRDGCASSGGARGARYARELWFTRRRVAADSKRLVVRTLQKRIPYAGHNGLPRFSEETRLGLRSAGTCPPPRGGCRLPEGREEKATGVSLDARRAP